MIGDKIKELRKELDLTQEELASKLSLSRQCISRWENNSNEPSINDIKNLCEILNTTSDYLLGLTKIKTNKYYRDKGLQNFLNGCVDLYYSTINKK